MIPRRLFLASLLAASAPVTGWAAAGSPAFLAAARAIDNGTGTDSFLLCGLRADGSLAFRLPLPARGHAGAAHPTRPLAVAIARRPGLHALVLDCAEGRVLRRLSPPDGHHFNGHATFLDAGRVLVTAEQRADTSEGIAGFWDAATWTRLDQRPTGGIGPHEIRTLPDDATLVVANGGIATDPTDRTKLNLPTMRPNLALLHPDGTTTLTELPGALHQASIRHLALSPAGRIAFAMQWEGDPADAVPLLGLVTPGADPVLADLPPAETVLMQGYAGSVAFSGDGTAIAITSPPGGRVQRFDAAGRFLSAQSRADVCGLAPCGSGLLMSDGAGALIRLGGRDDGDGAGAALLARHPLAWDNHIVALSPA